MFRIESETQNRTVRFAVYAQPRASRTEVVGEHGDALKIRLAAPPVEGAANAELVSFLAKKLGVSKSAVRLVKGERGRQKLVEVEGLDPEELTSRLGLSSSD
jgi:uncharacterized protein (TIGR00251 family)